jgi:hypothetical protein
MKTKTISDYPLLMGELIRPRPMVQDPPPTLVDLFQKQSLDAKALTRP